MTWTSPFRQQNLLAAALLVAMTVVPGRDAWATPIIYFGDGKTSGGGGGGWSGSISHGPTGAGGSGSGFLGIPRSTPSSPSGRPTSVPIVSSSQNETDSTVTVDPVRGASSGYSNPTLATGNGAVVGTPSTEGSSPAGPTGSSQTPSSFSAANAATSSTSIDPVTDYFENLSVDLGEVDVREGPKAAPLAQAFDAAEIIDNVVNVPVSSTPAVTDPSVASPTLSFGVPGSGVTLTADDFRVDALQDAELNVPMPEPASLFLLGAGLLLTAQYRRLRRRSRGHTPAK